MEHNSNSKSGKKSHHNRNPKQNPDQNPIKNPNQTPNQTPNQNQYQNPYQNQYTGPTSYSVGAHWTSDDLGNQPQFSAPFGARSGSLYSSHGSSLEAHNPSQPMYRNDSQSSNSTGYNNPAYSPVDFIDPNFSSPVDFPDPNFSFDQNNSNYFLAATNSYPEHQPPSLGLPADSVPHWATPRTEFASYQQLSADTSSSQMSPVPMQSSGMQAAQTPKYCCLMDNCNTSFARQADLQRHYDHKHTPLDQQKTWYCDWKTCPRSEQGSRDALKRLSASSSSSSSSASNRMTGIGPFTRKDHYKAHLREQHQEAIPKRDAKNDPGWMEGKRLNIKYWRCGKCLKRVWIQSQRMAGRDEYTCCNCGSPCDKEVLEGRSRMFAAGASSLDSGSGGGASSLSSSSRKSKY